LFRFDNQIRPKASQQLNNVLGSRHVQDDAGLVVGVFILRRDDATSAEPISNGFDYFAIRVCEIHAWMKGDCVLPVLPGGPRDLYPAFSVEKCRKVAYLGF